MDQYNTVAWFTQFVDVRDGSKSNLTGKPIL